MVSFCCVIGCTCVSHNNKGEKKTAISFHRFPAWRKTEGRQISDLTKKRRLAWVAAVRRTTITFESISPTMRVCSRHFHSGKPAYEMYTTHPDWAPSLYLGHTEIKPTSPGRFQRMQRRSHRVDAETCVSPVEEAEQLTAGPSQEAPHAAQAMEEEPTLLEADGDDAEEDQGTIEECDFCQLRRDEINRLLMENQTLKKELEMSKMNEGFLRDDAAKVRYYTGLPDFEVVMALLASIFPRLAPTTRALSPFQMLFLTLMRLRLKLPIQHIAYLFNVDRKTATKAFNDMLNVLYATVSPLVNWPSRESLYATMPHQFVEAFGKRIAVILDCFEIFIQKPSNLKAQAQSYSHYKHNNTMKYLIGVTPQGAISFISKGWGGRVSDKHITENSGILDKLLPGDLVLADRGFDIHDSVGLMCAEVKIPAFTKGRCQLDARDVEHTRKIAHLRIHVERVIGNIRNKYTILADKVPISLVLPCEGEDVTILDKIVIVCCALTNMSPSVVVKSQ